MSLVSTPPRRRSLGWFLPAYRHARAFTEFALDGEIRGLGHESREEWLGVVSAFLGRLPS